MGRPAQPRHDDDDRGRAAHRRPGRLALLVLGPIQLQSWHLCVSAAVYGIGTGLYNPAQLGLTPELVPEERLQEANGLLSVVADLGFLLGPALAGVLMGTVGFSWVLWLDCASFAVNLALLLRLRRIWTPTRHTAAPAADGPATAEQPADDDRFVAGFAVMARYPWFGAGMALWFVVSLGIGLVAVAGPVIAVDSLGGTGAWSVLATCLAVGSLLGSLAVVAATRRYAWRTAAAAVALGAVLQFVALALHDRMPLALVGAAFALTALTTAACGVIWDSAYQSEIPERYVSRLASVDNFVNSAGTPVGMLLGGLLAAHYDTLFLGLAVATALLCIPAAGLAAPARKAVRP
ncbi:MFS transporter [Kitasatospora arboriphila]